MIITVNGQQLDFSLEQEQTIGEVLSAIEENCVNNNAAITSICVDGKVLSEENFNEIFNASLDSFNHIDLETIAESDVYNLLENMAIVLQDISKRMLEVPVLLQSNKDTEVSSIVVSFVDAFSYINKTLYFITIFPDQFKNLSIGGQSPSDFMQEFMPILQDFENSLESGDTVLTSDLAEYEIVPRLDSLIETSQSYCGAT